MNVKKEKERLIGNRKFRNGKDTLKLRITKKLNESTTWFKNNKNKNKPRWPDLEKGKFKGPIQ